MRYCPTCESKFDDEKILFCTKDGTPLVDGSVPSFTDNLPSESVSDDDQGEDTVVRSKKPAAPVIPDLPDDEDFEEESTSSRIVIDTAEKPEPAVQRPAPVVAPVTAAPAPQPSGPSTGLVVFFSVLGTLIVVIGLFLIYLLLTMRGAADANANINANENLNANENIEENFNADELLDLNSNINTNTETPTPTPTPSPSPSPSPDANSNTNAGANTVADPPPTQVPATPRPTVQPTPSPATAPGNTNRPVNVGTINSRAVTLPLPSYPSAARQARATGRVAVSVMLDENGRVVEARATAGHPLLRRSAENAALRSRFRPVSINGTAVPATGTILYNFID